MGTYFEGFDFTNFWDDCDYAKKAYIETAPSDELIADVEQELGSQFMVDEWEYPAIGVAICGCSSAEHDMIFLDYQECGPKGEPKAVHVDQEYDYEITLLADTFEDFIRGLVNEEVYEPDPEEEKAEQEYLKEYPNMIVCGGAFSTGGSAPSFVEEWLKNRKKTGVIQKKNGMLMLSEAAKEQLRERRQGTVRWTRSVRAAPRN